ncbi:MAG: thiamine pyrophosphate-binding protein [Dehalococcoidia bacterium]|nr:thiamine pyrophosphate-binding protein [Dehalococcoidia bacterium]
MNGGRVIARILKDHGVQHVFGIPAGHVWAIDTGLHEQGIRRIHMRHQQSAAFAADAYGRCTLTPGVCFGTAGMGITDSVTGINQAWLANSPVIGLFGMHHWDGGRRGVLQEAYPGRILDSVTKSTIEIDDGNLIPLYLHRAFRDCMAYPPGPVALSFTMGALGPMVRGERALLGDMVPEDVATPSMVCGDPAAVQKVVRMLVQAERPVMVAGDGVHWSGAGAELQELIELLQIPLHMRRTARGCVPETHALTFGGAYRSDVWRHADLVVIIGLRLGWLEWYGLPPAWPPDAKRIVIHESATDGWSPLPTEAFVVGNPKLVLRQMIEAAIPLAKANPPKRSDWVGHLKACQQSSQTALAEDEKLYEDRDPMHPWLLAREIAASLGQDATIILDSFLGSAFLTDRVCATFPGQLLDSGEAGNFGHGIGMGIGAQLARPGKPVFVLMGDAGMGVAGGDIETAVRYGLPIVYLVCNTDSWFAGADAWFEGQVDSWRMLPGIRYDKMYEPLGCHVEQVTRPNEVGPALRRAFDSGKTSVINVPVDGKVMPPWFEALAYRIGVVAHQLDIMKIPEPFRTYLLKGRTPEIDEALEKLGVARSTPHKRVLTHDLVKCW